MSPLALSLRLLQTQPDERLVQLARGGHEPAFEALVRRYRRSLLAYCRRLSVPDASSEDIVQQALLQAWRALAAGAEIRDPRAWLYRIVHNVAIRSGVRRGVDGPVELAQAIRTDGVEQLVEQRLAARDALAGLAALPELQREVMLGTAVEGRSHEEVAGALGLTSGSVRGLIYRARATLRAASAVLVPTPVVEWALRQQQAGRGTAPAVYEALAAGGSAGVAGVVLKGGAIATVAGALAGTAVLIAGHPAHQYPPPRVAIASPVRHQSAPGAASGGGAMGPRLAAGPTAPGDARGGTVEVASVQTPSRSTSTPDTKQASSGGGDRQPNGSGGDSHQGASRHHADHPEGGSSTAQAFTSASDDPPEHAGTQPQSGSTTVETAPTGAGETQTGASPGGPTASDGTSTAPTATSTAQTSSSTTATGTLTVGGTTNHDN